MFKVGDKLKGKATTPRKGYKAEVIAELSEYSILVRCTSAPPGSDTAIGHTCNSFTSLWELDSNSSVTAPIVSSGEVINNHTCPTCKNTRCNKAESSCWRCGGKL